MGLLEDARNIQRKDPAARSVLEVMLLYPGFHILVYHRIAHWLYQHKHFFLARWVSQHGRHRTGIEIHPGATIGKCLFIDHGMGIVFGETCEIGDNCTIYHGVTLGGTGKDTGKRHPTLGNNVLIGAGTKVLGPVFIGDNARIGAGSVVLRNLPANCTAVGVPAEVVRINNKAVNPADDLDQQDLPDIVSQRLTDLDRRLSQLEKARIGGGGGALCQRFTDADCFPQSFGRSVGTGHQFGSQYGSCFCGASFGQFGWCCFEQARLYGGNSPYHSSYCRFTFHYGTYCFRFPKSKGQCYFADYRCDDWLHSQCGDRCAEIFQCGGGYSCICHLGVGKFCPCIGRMPPMPRPLRSTSPPGVARCSIASALSRRIGRRWS